MNKLIERLREDFRDPWIATGVGLSTVLLGVMAYCGITSHPVAPKREDFSHRNTYTITKHHDEKNVAVLLDINHHGRINAITGSKAGGGYIAIDPKALPNYMGDRTIPMDSSMVDIATKIDSLEKELAFRLESAHYARRK